MGKEPREKAELELNQFITKGIKLMNDIIEALPVGEICGDYCGAMITVSIPDDREQSYSAKQN